MRYSPIVANLALVTLVFAAYLPGLAGGFAFDDGHAIVDNHALVVPQWSLTALLDAAFSSPETGLAMRPLAMLSFAANRSLNGPDPFAFKLTNIAIHALNALLVLALLRQLLPRLAPRAPLAATAWWCAAAWAVHPINLTSVLYVVQRMTSLASTFMLAALLIYAHARNRHLAGHAPWPGWWLMVALCAVLALLTKETAVSLALYLPVLELSVFGWRAAPGLRRFYAVAAVVGGLTAIAVLVAFPDPIFGSYRVREFTPSERLLTEARIALDYLRLIVVPVPRGFTLYHDDIELSHGLFDPPATALAFVVLTLMACSALWRRCAFVTFGCCWFIAGHLLESTVLPLELMHEHRNYLPAIGIIVLLVCAATRLGEQVTSRVLGTAAVTLGLGLLVAVTAIRAAVWCDPAVQLEFEYLHHPRSWRLSYEVGRLRVERAGQQADPALYASGIAALERAAALAPIPTLPYSGLLKAAIQRRDQAAIAALLDRVRNNPRAAVRVNVLRDLIYCQGYDVCRHDPEAVTVLAHAVIDQSKLDQAQRAFALEWLAIYYIRVLGDSAAAVAILRDLVTESPHDPALLMRLAEAFAVTGQQAERQQAAQAGLAALPWHAAPERTRHLYSVDRAGSRPCHRAWHPLIALAGRSARRSRSLP